MGIALATAMAAVFLVLFLLDLLGYLTNPYIGLLVFVAIPALFVIGLLLIPLGMWREARRIRAGGTAAAWPIIDLRNPQHRNVALAVIVLTMVNLVIVSIAAYGGAHAMETTEFCGLVCHTTMEPQYVAHQVGPHARVACVQCHVGPGAEALVESKLAGARQLLHVMIGQVPKPVPTPSELIQPARNTCEQCHWSEKFHGDQTRVIREFASDESNTETATSLVMHIGGGSRALGVGTGIHWHMNLDNAIEYVAADRDTIPYVRLQRRDGTTVEFIADGASRDQFASAERVRMDCMDCHNRPAHTFQPTPERAIDAAIAQGQIPRQLPFVRREAVAAVSESYADKRAALDGIAKRLEEFYRERGGADAGLTRRAVSAAQDAWQQNVFPEMKVGWGTYRSQLGHVDAPGCFRCHDDNHKASDGSVIRQDCELCHTLPE